MTSQGMAPFTGFIDPPAAPDAPRWIQRINSLVSRFPNTWAKYGPFHSIKSARNCASDRRKEFENSLYPNYGWQLDVETFEEEDGAFIYLKAWKPGDEDDS